MQQQQQQQLSAKRPLSPTFDPAGVFSWGDDREYDDSFETNMLLCLEAIQEQPPTAAAAGAGGAVKKVKTAAPKKIGVIAAAAIPLDEMVQHVKEAFETNFATSGTPVDTLEGHEGIDTWNFPLFGGILKIGFVITQMFSGPVTCDGALTFMDETDSIWMRANATNAVLAVTAIFRQRNNWFMAKLRTITGKDEDQLSVFFELPHKKATFDQIYGKDPEATHFPDWLNFTICHHDSRPYLLVLVWGIVPFNMRFQFRTNQEGVIGRNRSSLNDNRTSYTHSAREFFGVVAGPSNYKSVISVDFHRHDMKTIARIARSKQQVESALGSQKLTDSVRVGDFGRRNVIFGPQMVADIWKTVQEGAPDQYVEKRTDNDDPFFKEVAYGLRIHYPNNATGVRYVHCDTVFAMCGDYEFVKDALAADAAAEDPYK